MPQVGRKIRRPRAALSVQGRRGEKQVSLCVEIFMYRAVHAQRGVDLRRRDADAG